MTKNKKKQTAVPKPTKSQQASSKYIEKLVDNSKSKSAETQKSSRQRAGTVKRSPNSKDGVQLPLSEFNPAPTPTITILIPKRKAPSPPTLTSRDIDPLSKESFQISDKRHCNGGLSALPRVNLPKIPIAPVKQVPFRFLDLPREIQDMVYDIAIPTDTYEVIWINGHQRSKSLTYRYPRKIGGPKLLPGALERRYRHQQKPNNCRRQMLQNVHHHPSPISLLWVCRQMYIGASKTFYNKSILQFSGLRTLRYFLDSVTDTNKQNVRSMKLVHEPYGHPSQTKFDWWKLEADSTWATLCARIETECPNIKVLNLELCMNSCPISFSPLHREMIATNDFSKHWMLPLLPFKNLQLERVICKIQSYYKPDTVLEVESHNLRREIMGDKWDDKKKKSRDAYGYSCRKVGKCPRILNVVL